jgi:hypothetical protein
MRGTGRLVQQARIRGFSFSATVMFIGNQPTHTAIS